jgi:hypothetical protein
VVDRLFRWVFIVAIVLTIGLSDASRATAQNGVVLKVWEGSTLLTTRPVPLVNGHTYKFVVTNTIQAESFGSLQMDAFYGHDIWTSESWTHDVEPGTSCSTSGLTHTCSGGANSVTSITFTGTVNVSSSGDTARGRIGTSIQWDSAEYTS